MLHIWRPLFGHDHLPTLPARSMQSSPALTPQSSKKAATGPVSPRSDASMSAVPLKSDWQLRALHAEPASGRPSFDGNTFLPGTPASRSSKSREPERWCYPRQAHFCMRTHMHDGHVQQGFCDGCDHSVGRITLELRIQQNGFVVFAGAC